MGWERTGWRRPYLTDDGRGLPAPRFAGLLGVFLGVVATMAGTKDRAPDKYRCPAESSFDETHPRAAGLESR